MKLAILINRAGPTNARLFRMLAEQPDVSLSVYYCSDVGIGKNDFDAGFNRAIDWGTDMLEGHPHRFLKNWFSFNKTNDAWLLNPGIVVCLWREKFDCLVIYGWNSLTQWIAFFVAKFLGTKVLIWGENPLNQERAKSDSIRTSLKRLLLKLFLSRADGSLYIGAQNKAFYEFFGVPEEKLFFVPYATDNKRCERARHELSSSRTAIRARVGIPEKAIAVLFVGRLIEKKNPGDLLKAFVALKNGHSFPDAFHLIFVGDGALKDGLEQKVRNEKIPNVHFEGFKKKDELYPYFVASDIFVLPSGIGETWGLVVNEAMCFGLPIVASDMVGCAADLVRDGENGYTFPVHNGSSLAASLEKLIGDQKLRERFGMRSREIIGGYSQERDVEGIVPRVVPFAQRRRSDIFPTCRKLHSSPVSLVRTGATFRSCYSRKDIKYAACSDVQVVSTPRELIIFSRTRTLTRSTVISSTRYPSITSSKTSSLMKFTISAR